MARGVGRLQGEEGSVKAGQLLHRDPPRRDPGSARLRSTLAPQGSAGQSEVVFLVAGAVLAEVLAVLRLHLGDVRGGRPLDLFESRVAAVAPGHGHALEPARGPSGRAAVTGQG